MDGEYWVKFAILRRLINEDKKMFKNILKCSIFVLMVFAIVACDKDDDNRFHRGDGNGASCYRNGHNSVNCHRN